MEREPIRQENLMGCAVACVAFISGISYNDALDLFPQGPIKAETAGFICSEIVEAFTRIRL